MFISLRSEGSLRSFTRVRPMVVGPPPWAPAEKLPLIRPNPFRQRRGEMTPCPLSLAPDPTREATPSAQRLQALADTNPLAT